MNSRPIALALINFWLILKIKMAPAITQLWSMSCAPYPFNYYRTSDKIGCAIGFGRIFFFFLTFFFH